MPAEPDQKASALERDVDALALIFKRLLKSDVWSQKEKPRLLKKVNSVLAQYQSKCVELGIVLAPVKRRSTNGHSMSSLRRSA